MVVTRLGTHKRMEEELATIKTKLEDLDKNILSLHALHSPMETDDNTSLLQTVGLLPLATLVGRSLIFLSSMVMIRLDGFTGPSNISVYITLLMSIKSHSHPFIWNMNPFNGYVGTSRLMTRHNGQISANSFCTIWPSWF